MKSYEHIENDNVICRKSYTCPQCGHRVHKGDRAREVTYKIGGKIKHAHLHLWCWWQMYPGEEMNPPVMVGRETLRNASILCGVMIAAGAAIIWFVYLSQ